MNTPFLQSTRARLLLLILLVIVPAFAVQGYGAWNDLQREITARKQEAGQIVVRAQGKFETLLDTSRSVFTELVRLNEMRTPNNCTLIYNNLRLAYERLAPDAINVGLADPQGNIFCAVNPVVGDMNIASHPDFLRAAQTLDMAIGDYALNPGTGLPALGVAYPVLSFDGKLQTVVFITYELRWLENWQKEVALPPGVALTLISPNGEILQRYLDNAISPSKGSIAQSEWYAPLQSGQTAIEAPDLDGVTRLHTLAPLRLGTETAAWLHLGYPVAEIYTQAQQALSFRLTLLCAIFVVALGLAWWGSETLFLRPLNGLMRVVEKVQHGDLSARATDIRAVGELTGLAQSFDAMAGALQQREIARRQMEERFRAAFESSAIGMGLLGLDGKILQVNEAVCTMSGFTEAELLQRYDYENVYPDDRDIGMDLFAELLEDKRASVSIEKRYMRKSGEVFWTRLTLSLVRDEGGKPAYLVGQIEDIDEQKRKSAELAESEARFRTMFMTSAIGIGLMGLDRKLTDANPALCQMFGYSREELLGQTNKLVVHPDDYPRAAQGLQDILAGKFDIITDERRYIRKNSETIWARITMSMVRDDQDKPLYIVGSLEDITERKLADEKLAAQEANYRRTLEQRVEERTHELAETNLRLVEEIEQRRRAEEALSAKAAEEAVAAERTRLARDLHDAVTQTLFAASLIAEVLPDLWAMDLEEAQKSTEELRQLTRGALAEMRTLLLELRPAALTQAKLGDLIRQLCEALIGRARLPITLVVEGDRPIPPEVQVAFYRIAQESLNNVFKYARATKVDVGLFMSPAGAHFNVCDNGIGFDMSIKKATSLGLRIMRERAEAVGAQFSISSEPGHGTSVEVEWIEQTDMKLSVFKN